MRQRLIVSDRDYVSLAQVYSFRFMCDNIITGRIMTLIRFVKIWIEVIFLKLAKLRGLEGWY